MVVYSNIKVSQILDYLPILSEVSGTFFEYNSEDDVYISKEDQVSSLTDCFLLRYAPYFNEKQDSIYEYQVKLDADGNLESITAYYDFNDSLDGLMYTGSYTLTYSDVGTTTLEGIIA